MVPAPRQRVGACRRPRRRGINQTDPDAETNEVDLLHLRGLLEALSESRSTVVLVVSPPFP